MKQPIQILIPLMYCNFLQSKFFSCKRNSLAKFQSSNHCMHTTAFEWIPAPIESCIHTIAWTRAWFRQWYVYINNKHSWCFSSRGGKTPTMLIHTPLNPFNLCTRPHPLFPLRTKSAPTWQTHSDGRYNNGGSHWKVAVILEGIAVVVVLVNSGECRSDDSNTSSESEKSRNRCKKIIHCSPFHHPWLSGMGW